MHYIPLHLPVACIRPFLFFSVRIALARTEDTQRIVDASTLAIAFLLLTLRYFVLNIIRLRFGDVFSAFGTGSSTCVF